MQQQTTWLLVLVVLGSVAAAAGLPAGTIRCGNKVALQSVRLDSFLHFTESNKDWKATSRAVHGADELVEVLCKGKRRGEALCAGDIVMLHQSDADLYAGEVEGESNDVALGVEAAALQFHVGMVKKSADGTCVPIVSGQTKFGLKVLVDGSSGNDDASFHLKEAPKPMVLSLTVSPAGDGSLQLQSAAHAGSEEHLWMVQAVAHADDNAVVKTTATEEQQENEDKNAVASKLAAVTAELAAQKKAAAEEHARLLALEKSLQQQQQQQSVHQRVRKVTDGADSLLGQTAAINPEPTAAAAAHHDEEEQKKKDPIPASFLSKLCPKCTGRCTPTCQQHCPEECPRKMIESEKYCWLFCKQLCTTACQTACPKMCVPDKGVAEDGRAPEGVADAKPMQSEDHPIDPRTGEPAKVKHDANWRQSHRKIPTAEITAKTYKYNAARDTDMRPASPKDSYSSGQDFDDTPERDQPRMTKSMRGGGRKKVPARKHYPQMTVQRTRRITERDYQRAAEQRQRDEEQGQGADEEHDQGFDTEDDAEDGGGHEEEGRSLGHMDDNNPDENNDAHPPRPPPAKEAQRGDDNDGWNGPEAEEEDGVEPPPSDDDEEQQQQQQRGGGGDDGDDDDHHQADDDDQHHADDDDQHHADDDGGDDDADADDNSEEDITDTDVRRQVERSEKTLDREADAAMGNLDMMGA